MSNLMVAALVSIPVIILFIAIGFWAKQKGDALLREDPDN